LKADISSVNGVVPLEVAEYLLNKKRREILDLEERRNLSITIEGDSTMDPGENKIVCH
jgi:ribonuclease E